MQDSDHGSCTGPFGHVEQPPQFAMTVDARWTRHPANSVTKQAMVMSSSPDAGLALKQDLLLCPKGTGRP